MFGKVICLVNQKCTKIKAQPSTALQKDNYTWIFSLSLATYIRKNRSLYTDSKWAFNKNMVNLYDIVSVPAQVSLLRVRCCAYGWHSNHLHQVQRIKLNGMGHCVLLSSSESSSKTFPTIDDAFANAMSWSIFMTWYARSVSLHNYFWRHWSRSCDEFYPQYLGMHQTLLHEFIHQ